MESVGRLPAAVNDLKTTAQHPRRLTLDIRRVITLPTHFSWVTFGVIKNESFCPMHIRIFRFIRIRVRSDADAADRTPRSLRRRWVATAAELPRHPPPPYRDEAR